MRPGVPQAHGALEKPRGGAERGARGGEKIWHFGSLGMLYRYILYYFIWYTHITYIEFHYIYIIHICISFGIRGFSIDWWCGTANFPNFVMNLMGKPMVCGSHCPVHTKLPGQGDKYPGSQPQLKVLYQSFCQFYGTHVSNF